MSSEEIERKAADLQKKYKVLLQHKTLELLLHDMVSVQGLKETRDCLKWWYDRLDEF